ncbi:MAG: hypothetical protein ACI4T5_10420 [Prevotella sp.]
MENEAQQFEFLDILAIISFAMQLVNQQNIAKQVTANDLMHELRKQDQEYLGVIIEQNKHIIELLETSLGRSAQST